MCILVALVLTVTHKEARKWVISDHLHPCGVGFPISYCHGEWNSGPSFWTQIQAAVNRRALHGICREGNLKGVVLWKVMAAVVWDKNGFVGTCDSSEQWTLASDTRTLKSECLLSLSSFQKKNVGSVHFHDSAWHTQTCNHWEHHRSSIYGTLTFAVLFSPHTMKCSSLVSFQIVLARTSLGGWWVTAQCLCQWLQRKGSDFAEHD
jgi:hypothetical protein